MKVYWFLAANTPTLGDDLPVVPWDPTTWGFGQWIAAIASFGTLVTLYLTFRKNRSDEINGKTNVKVQLDKMIDDRVERQLQSAWDRIDALDTRVGDLEEEVERERQEKSRIKIAWRRYMTALVFWDQGGRRGDMPMPSEADMELMDMDPYDTAQGEVVRVMRERLRGDSGAGPPASV